MHESAGFIEATFQNEAMEMGIESQKFAAGLISQNHTGHDARMGRFVVKSLNNGEDKSADIGKQAPVVAEVGPQDAW